MTGRLVIVLVACLAITSSVCLTGCEDSSEDETAEPASTLYSSPTPNSADSQSVMPVMTVDVVIRNTSADRELFRIRYEDDDYNPMECQMYIDGNSERIWTERLRRHSSLQFDVFRNEEGLGWYEFTEGTVASDEIYVTYVP